MQSVNYSHIIAFLLLLSSCANDKTQSHYEKNIFRYPHSSDSLLEIYKDGSNKDTTRLQSLYLLGTNYLGKNDDSAKLVSRQLLVDAKKYKLNDFSGKAYSLLANTYIKLGDKDSALLYIQRSLQIRISEKDNKQIGDSYNQLGYFYYLESLPDSAIAVYQMAAKKYGEAGYERGRAQIHNRIGQSYLILSEYDSSVHHFKAAAAYFKSKNDLLGLSVSLVSTGNSYYMKSDYRQALDYYLQAVTVNEKLKNKKYTAAILTNIGLVYLDLTDYREAIVYQKKSLAIEREMKNRLGEASTLANLAMAYEHLEVYDSALNYLSLSMQIYQELDDRFSIAQANLSHGNILIHMQKFDEALVYELKALPAFEEIGSKHFLAITNCNLAEIYMEQNKLSLAEKHAITGLKLAEEAELADTKRDVLEILADCYNRSGDSKKAFAIQQAFIEMKDSLNNTQVQNEITRKDIAYSYDKKAVEEKLRNEEKAREEKLRHEIEITNQKTYTYGGIAGFTLMLLVSVVSIRAYRQKRRSETAITQQKKIVEEKAAELSAKQKEILDSISYAKRIQDALLPKEKDLKNLFEESFVLFNPRDIVSGDFYWLHQTKDSVILAVGDCTGHGVPGGFMSMLGNSFLNEIVIEKKVEEPAEILNQLREKIIYALKQHSRDAESKDGMDIVLCQFENNKTHLKYAAANNNFHLVRAGELFTLHADHMPIGYQSDEHIPFAGQSIPLKKGDTLFIHTDGYADQFGGSKGKKYLNRRMENFFKEIGSSDCTTQKEKLLKEFNQWKGELEQVDDVCIIGIKL